MLPNLMTEKSSIDGTDPDSLQQIKACENAAQLAYRIDSSSFYRSDWLKTLDSLESSLTDIDCLRLDFDDPRRITDVCEC